MDCDPEDAESTSKVDDTDTVVHPWPYLASIFEFLSTSAKAHRCKCLLCLPKVTECSAYHNLKKHVKLELIVFVSLSDVNN